MSEGQQSIYHFTRSPSIHAFPNSYQQHLSNRTAYASTKLKRLIKQLLIAFRDNNIVTNEDKMLWLHLHIQHSVHDALHFSHVQLSLKHNEGLTEYAGLPHFAHSHLSEATTYSQATHFFPTSCSDKGSKNNRTIISMQGRQVGLHAAFLLQNNLS